jgi:hypothetical protein
MPNLVRQQRSRCDDPQERIPAVDIPGSLIPHTNCLFEQPWWLDGVAPGSWDAATVMRGGQVVARLPYVVRKRFGLCLATNPPLTPTLGPWIRPSEGKYATQLADHHELVNELIQQLPRCDLFAQSFPPGVGNSLPFHWNGYVPTIRYTYRIEDLSDLEVVWSDLTDACRRAIRKAQKHVAIREDLGIDAFYDVVGKTWDRQGLRTPFRREFLHRLDENCTRHSARRILHAEDAQSRVHAAIYVVYDERTAYYLVGGADPELRSSGAHSLLMWSAIQFASSVTRVFDFEGSMDKHVERFFRTFGARQTPLIHVRKNSRRMAALNAVVHLAEAASGRRIKWFC